jgi:hypothetical protein
LQDCLFVMDWYLNFTNDEKAQEWVKICRWFCTPTKSAKLLIEYNPMNPQVIGIGDSVDLCRQRKSSTKAQIIISGGTQAQQNVNDPHPRMNAQPQWWDCERSRSTHAIAAQSHIETFLYYRWQQGEYQSAFWTSSHDYIYFFLLLVEETLGTPSGRLWCGKSDSFCLCPKCTC